LRDCRPRRQTRRERPPSRTVRFDLQVARCCITASLAGGP
jgi:hypothetical protein